jgi:selenocysteine lyase/cysteine desulfurase
LAQSLPGHFKDRLFHIKDLARIVFTLNVTESLNLVFSGFLKSGDHVVTTAMEHNSVARPLKYLAAGHGI